MPSWQDTSEFAALALIFGLLCVIQSIKLDDRDGPSSGACTVEYAAARLCDWTVFCIDSGVPRACSIGRHHRHLTHLLAYFTTGRISNRPTEDINLVIRKSCGSARA